VPLPSTTAAPPHHDSARNTALDGLRGVAVLMVFVFHYGGGLRSQHIAVRLLGVLTQAGWTGVVLFFALSGVLITGGLWDSLRPDTPSDVSSRANKVVSSRPEARSAAVEKPVLSLPKEPVAHATVLRNFYARRALRILPLYYAALLAAAVAAMVCSCAVANLRPLAIYALFLQNLPGLSQFVIRNPTPLPLYHLWSLAVEEQFYLLWPALLLLARTRRSAIYLCLWSFAVAVVFRLAVYGLPCLDWAAGLHNPLPDKQLFDFFLLTQCGALTLGAALALILRGGEATLQKLHRWAMPAFLAGLAMYALNSWLCRSLLLGAPSQYILGLPAVSVAAAALLLLLLRSGIPRTLASVRPLPWLGRISYGFYVFHILLQPLYDRIAVRISHAAAGNSHYQIARFAIALCLTVLISWLSYRLLELPFLRAKRHFPLRPSLPPMEPRQ
jgi:peptidoglycan/LPS O-acetylase OafA/YrhL